jgi:hypothetical protein
MESKQIHAVLRARSFEGSYNRIRDFSWWRRRHLELKKAQISTPMLMLIIFPSDGRHAEYGNQHASLPFFHFVRLLSVIRVMLKNKVPSCAPVDSRH